MKSIRLIKFYHAYHIKLSHSTNYYPQGNGLAEYSNKSLIRIIKKLLEDNKKAWHTKLKFALLEDMISTKRSIDTTRFQLVYNVDATFLVSIGIPVMRCLQELGEKLNHLQRRINQLIEVQEDKVDEKAQEVHNQIKKVFDKKTKEDDLKCLDLVLKWDAHIEDKGKHEKFDNIWKVPYKIAAFRGKNSFILEDLEWVLLPGGPINGSFLKHYIS